MESARSEPVVYPIELKAKGTASLGLGHVEAETVVHEAGGLTDEEQAFLAEVMAQGYTEDQALEAIARDRAEAEEAAQLPQVSPVCQFRNCGGLAYRVMQEGDANFSLCKRHFKNLRNKFANPKRAIPSKRAKYSSRRSA